jgi:hypothetical protein
MQYGISPLKNRDFNQQNKFCAPVKELFFHFQNRFPGCELDDVFPIISQLFSIDILGLEKDLSTENDTP